MTHRAYSVYLNDKEIDTVFYTAPKGESTRGERELTVKKGLVDHDGYNPAIVVLEEYREEQS